MSGLDAVMPLRVVIATLVVMVMPGALLWTALGGRARHWLETVAIGIFGSAAVVAVAGLIAFAAGATIDFITYTVFAANAAALLVLWRRGAFHRLVPRQHRAGDLLLLIPFTVFAIVAFRWGDDIREVGWEVALHVAYVRQYASGLPLGFHTAVLRPPEIAAQNYFYLWELMLAAVARVSGIDPMAAALKARWCVPVFGFAAFFFMVQRLVRSTGVAATATWVMVAAVAVQFLTLPPNAYDILIQSGPLRQVGAFFGSIHHSDSAMEILLPLLIGLLFWALHAGGTRAWSWFSIALVVAFLWHPREYFQVMWYGGVAIAVDLLAGLGRPGAWKPRARAYAVMIACYVGVALLLYLGMPSVIRASSEHAAGMATQIQEIKKFASSLTDWASWRAGSLPFATHLHGYEAPGLAPGPPLVFSWMVLSVPMAAVLIFARRRTLRWMGLYLLVVWVMSLCSYKFEQLLQAITYHEILISKPRLIHLFAYTVIGLGFTEMMRRAAGRVPGVVAVIRALTVSLVAGLVFAFAWRSSAPEFTLMFRVLSLAFFAILIALVVSLRLRHRQYAAGPARLPPVYAGLAFAVFALPACIGSAALRWEAMLERRLDAATLYTEQNPVELAPETIRYLQTQHPARQRLQVEPNRPYMVGVYAPVYVIPLLGNIGADNLELQAGRGDTHPVFNKAIAAGGGSIADAYAYLVSRNVTGLLGTGDFARAFAEWPAKDPQRFTLKFQSGDGRNVILSVQ